MATKIKKRTKAAKVETVAPIAAPAPETVLVLRTCDKDLRSHGGFQWPTSGLVECPDWKPTPECGNGLHGLLWCEGDWGLLSKDADAKWLVVSVVASEVVKIDEQKVKFPRGEVVFVGGMAEATTRILCSPEEFERIKKLSYEKSIADGYYSTAASSGDYSTAASSGDYSTAASSGNSSRAASSGYYSTAASSGDYSRAASSGDYSTAASSGYYSTAASSGYSSTAASSGNYSKAASSGKSGIAASVGHGGWAMAGQNGLVIVCYWDEKNNRFRACVGNVGEDGIKADTKYIVENGKLVETK